MKPRPVLLAIFDGFGLNPSRAHNAWSLAATPYLDYYFACNPHSVLQASGRAVGLPDGQFGNSEVGHLTMGAGRVLEQDLTRIANAIYDGSLTNTPAWQDMINGHKRLHLAGMVSDGGVHSHIEHLIGLLGLLHKAGVEPVIHLFTDGRDTAPQAALRYLDQIEATLSELGSGHIATVIGRYSSMDRAKNWDRTERAWQAMIRAEGLRAKSPRAAISAAYDRNEGDEFIQATIIEGHHGIPADEPILFFNFRSDRARQLCAALGLPDFDDFDRDGEPPRQLVSMTEYDATFPFPVLFPSHYPENTLAEVLSDAGMTQLHCAETEKYPHVTYFFNGGREPPFPGEERIIVPSPKVATYDEWPAMSAPKVADKLIEGIRSDRFDFAVVNFANTDMVGHTARKGPMIRAVETLDTQGHRVFRAALERGWRVMLTSDHGNCDEMIDPNSGAPHTRHTPYPVPFLLMGEGPAKLGIGRGLADIAPTILDLLKVPEPPQMTGRSLILKDGLI